MAETGKDHLSIFISGVWDHTALVAIAGSMVTETGLQLRDAIADLLGNGVQHLVLNVHDVEGIDS
ncbi:MAG: hypothetical protein LC772_08105, partial [Chloroflexi bacterium]|nr:hypothetical protein [Chloroflexota bacterium]